VSSPPRPVLEPVQGLANYLAFMQQRGQEIDLQGETYTRLAQGLSGAQRAEAQAYADAAARLHHDLTHQPEDTALADLPSYDPAGGLSPVANVLHTYGEREAESGPLTRVEAYRSDQYALGPGSTAGGLLSAAGGDGDSYGYFADEDYAVDYEIEYVLPFNRYS
jgi:hypothetical protein